MHLEILVEERSAEVALQQVVPKIVGDQVSIRFITFQGKKDLLRKLPRLLLGYANWLPNDWRIVVLIDEDRQDCRQLKAQMEHAAHQAGLYTPANAVANQFQVVNRIAVEELEAWFFGDVPAIQQAYNRVSRHLAKQQNYRDPDAIPGGTWEALERVLQRAGYYPTGLAKTQVARDIARHMQPAQNRSKSFQLFRDTLKNLTEQSSQKNA